MTLRLDEFRAGAIAYFEPDVLLGDARMIRSIYPGSFRRGPFVCAAAEAGWSTWLEVTGTAGKVRPRFPIQKRWVRGAVPGGPWHTLDQYLNDIRQPFSGPDDIFIEASETEVLRSSRPWITGDGVAAIKAELEAIGLHRCLSPSQFMPTTEEAAFA